MEANELRIGNWVKWQYGYMAIGGSMGLHDEYYQISMNTFYTEVANNEGRTILKELHPIPLTHEILIACGFMKDEAGFIKKEGVGDTNWRMRLWDWPSGYKWVSNQIFEVTITNLHQLQNLYFALTNKELEFKP